ncbi:hypothetical protein [Dactylosporangium sp. NPDC005555]|uniref:hypothetical protein n=1 Tax=Dactylosporangium sp. NPDC005555 TaxID=3154889 RepID=UPI0033B6CFD5
MTALVEASIEQEVEQKLERAQAEIADRTVALEVANQRYEAALMIAQLLGPLVEKDGLAIVVADVVDCWRSLPSTTRKAYEERLYETELQAFAGDYTIVVDHSWRSPDREDALKDGAVEVMRRLSWQIRIAQIRQRQVLGEPLDIAWLDQFPLPADAD